MFAVCVCRSVRPSVSYMYVCHVAELDGGACSVRRVIRCSLCQITLASCL